MGISARDLQRMSIWEYSCMVDGWRKAHEVKREDEEDNMTPDLFREIMDRADANAERYRVRAN